MCFELSFIYFLDLILDFDIMKIFFYPFNNEITSCIFKESYDFRTLCFFIVWFEVILVI